MTTASIPAHWLRPLALSIVAGELRSNPLIAFCASVRQEGTTTTLLNLAHVLTEDLQHRVLLVDASIATPAVHQACGLQLTPGLADVLRGSLPLREAIQSHEDGRLAVLPAGRADAAEQSLLLSGPNLPAIFDHLRREAFDVCLIDCPSVLSSPETATVARHADVTYVVLRSEHTKWGAAEKCTDSLRAAGSNIGGVVLNQVKLHVPRFLLSVSHQQHVGFR